MRAVVIESSLAGPELRVRDVPDPAPGPADLLVRVRATSVNRADLRRAAVHFKRSEQEGAAAVAGLEMAGEVVGMGSDVSGFRAGDRVMAMAGGGYAELAVIDHRLALPVPAALNWSQAGATPTVYVTAHDALISQGRLAAGQSVLLQGASTGTGIAAVQVAHAWKARVFGTAGTNDKIARLRALGCDVPVNYRTSDVAKAVLDHTQQRGADLVIDLVGHGAVASNIAAVAIKGTIICIGRVGGTTDEIDLDEFARKRVTMTGTTFRTRTLEERAAVIRRFRDEMLPLFESGTIAPVLDSREFNLQDAAAAQAYMATNQHFGKIVLRVP